MAHRCGQNEEKTFEIVLKKMIIAVVERDTIISGGPCRTRVIHGTILDMGL